MALRDLKLVITNNFGGVLIGEELIYLRILIRPVDNPAAQGGVRALFITSCLHSPILLRLLLLLVLLVPLLLEQLYLGSHLLLFPCPQPLYHICAQIKEQ